jgi:hypothetical protein
MIIIDENSVIFEHTCKNNTNTACYACMLEMELSRVLTIGGECTTKRKDILNNE